MKKILKKVFFVAIVSAAVSTLTACEKTESYNDLLTKEENAVNWFLAGEEVCNEIPADSVFQVGEDAPYYKMDEDGAVYMKVLKVGSEPKPKKGDAVYFRYAFKNILDMHSGLNPAWAGNSVDLNGSIGARYFIFEEMQYTQTSEYGTGIQLPMQYFGTDTEVMLVVKSTRGFYSYQARCVPILYKIRYFSAAY